MSRTNDSSKTPPELNITPPKIAALVQALDQTGRVEFKNGSIVRRGGKGESGIVVERLMGGRSQRVIYSFGTHAYEKAYRCALHGPPPRELGRVDPGKRRKSHPEWEECPF